ncbi:M1 family metallopeptidase [Aggregatilinea lenta]|uniref:M1 family metallopeptidase n=1 Tax=Aggregatilinea lenta TaxID=913108 RepID=UPI000E5A312C|nr:M1 family metallopeptidase [Aggregatilinea lenta]
MTWRSVAARIALACIAALLVCAPRPAHGQGGDAADWTADFRPAMRPAAQGDMLAHSTAPRYTIALDIAPGADETLVSGQQTVSYTNRLTTALDTIVFRLYPNLDSFGARMTVGDVTVEGVTVERVTIAPDLDATHTVLTVPLSDPLPPGESVTLSMPFAITITNDSRDLYGQFGVLDGVLALPEAYPVLSVYEPGRGWWQETEHPLGDAVFSETAFYDVHVTAPAELILTASGSEIDLTSNDDGTLTHRFVAPLMRDFSLAASPHYVTLTGEQDGVLIRLLYDPAPEGTQTATQHALQVARDALRIYSELYGPYPFAELDIAQTPNSAGGLEYPGLIVLNGDVWAANTDYFTFLIVHEIAHQWWYSLVGNDQIRHPWIDEALAQYSVAQYILATEGEDAYAAALDSFRMQYEAFAATEGDAPIGLPISAYPDQATYWAFIYQKGPAFFALLDEQYGRDAVISALRALFAADRYGIATPDGVRSMFEQTLGTDLDALFADWVGGFPVG